MGNAIYEIWICRNADGTHTLSGMLKSKIASMAVRSMRATEICWNKVRLECMVPALEAYNTPGHLESGLIHGETHSSFCCSVIELVMIRSRFPQTNEGAPAVFIPSEGDDAHHSLS